MANTYVQQYLYSKVLELINKLRQGEKIVETFTMLFCFLTSFYRNLYFPDRRHAGSAVWILKFWIKMDQSLYNSNQHSCCYMSYQERNYQEVHSGLDSQNALQRQNCKHNCIYLFSVNTASLSQSHYAHTIIQIIAIS